MKGNKNFVILLFIILPSLSIGGPLLFPIHIGINFFAFRQAIILSLVIALFFSKNIQWYNKNILLFYTTVLSLWTAWGALSFLWAPVLPPLITDVSTLLISLLLAFSLFQMNSRFPGSATYLVVGWVYAFLFTIPVVIWELLTGKHLREMNVDMYNNVNLVRATFTNSNNFGVFTTLCFPFLVWKSIRSTSLFLKIVAVLGLLTVPFFLLLSASRFCIVTFIIQLISIVVLRMRKIQHFLGLFLLISTVFLSVVVSFPADLMVFQKFASIKEEIEQGSIRSRINLAKNGLWMMEKTYFIGVGAGNFEHYMKYASPPYNISRNVKNPHSLWIEIGSEYGVFILMLFVAFIMYLFIVLFRCRKKCRNRGKRLEVELLLSTLIGYVFSVSVPSSILKHSYHWMLLTTIVLLTAEKVVENNQKSNKCSPHNNSF